MKEINYEKLIKAARQVQEEYPEGVQIAYFSNGKGAVNASLEASARILKLVREGE